jgi:hypothetical protein
VSDAPEVPPVGVGQHERMLRHRETALDALERPWTEHPGDPTRFALVHACLALQASVDELIAWAMFFAATRRESDG